MKLSLNQKSSDLLLQVKDKTQKPMSYLLAEAMELLHQKYQHEVLDDQKETKKLELRS